MKSYTYIFVVTLLFSVILLGGQPVFAQSTAEELQVMIAELLQQIEALQAQIDAVGDTSTPAPQTPPIVSGTIDTMQFTRILRQGVSGNDVEDVQTYLAQFPDLYPEGLVTGYFGSLTERAVQRFQEKYGIVSSGSPATTGYGQIGPLTQQKFTELLAAAGAAPAPTPPPSTGETPLEDLGAVPLSMSGITVSSVTQTGAVVSWATNKPAPSSVEYTTTSLEDDSVSTDMSDSVAIHRAELSGLTPGTTYTFVVHATGVGESVTSAEYTFTTLADETEEQVSSEFFGHWTFDETEGTSVSDASGGGSVGVVYGIDPASAWVSGKIGGALKLKGDDDYLSISHTDAIDIGAQGQSYTVSFWFFREPLVVEREHTILAKANGAGPAPFIFRYDTLQYVTFRITDGEQSPYIRPPKDIITNGWNHIVGVRNAETDRMYLYINGEEGNGAGKGESIQDTTTKSLQNTQSIIANRYEAANGFYYYDDFSLDDVRIYKRALSAEEIKALYDEYK